MRISDWSSDVCSYDLEAYPIEALAALVALVLDDRIGADVDQRRRQSAMDREIVRRDLDHRVEAGTQLGAVRRTDLRLDQERVLQRHDLHPIGRASGRKRGCPYR